MERVDLIAIVIAMFFWGISNAVASLAMKHIQPFMMSYICFTIAGLLLLPYIKRDRKIIRQAAIISSGEALGYHSCYMLAMYLGLDSATCIIIAQLSVPITMVFGAWWCAEKLYTRHLIGIVLAFAGVIFILGSPSVKAHLIGFTLTIFGAVVVSFVNIYLKRIGTHEPLNLLGWVSLFNVPQLLLLSLLTETYSMAIVRDINKTTLISTLFMAICPNLISYAIWFRLINKYPVQKIMPFSLLMPLFGVFASLILNNVVLTLQMLIGGILIVVGIALCIFTRKSSGKYSF